jgi:DNA polymerase sigma
LYMPNKDIVDPRREKPLRESVLPRCTKSKTENEEPNRIFPYTDNAAPRRAKLRKDKAEPTLTKSSTESDDPKRAIP